MKPQVLLISALSILLPVTVCQSAEHKWPPDGESARLGSRFAVFAGPGTVPAPGSSSEPPSGSFQLTVAARDIRGATITSTCQRCAAQDFPTQEAYVSFGGSQAVVAPKTFAQTQGGVYDTVVLTTSVLPITVLVTSSYDDKFKDMFLALPLESLSNKYILANYDENGFVAIVAASPGTTSVSLHNSQIGPSALSCKGMSVPQGKSFEFQIEELQVHLLFCDYLTGTFLYSDQLVAVFVGNHDVIVNGSTTDDLLTIEEGHLQEQAFPMTACGKGFVVAGTAIGSMGDFVLKIVACYDKVKLVHNSMEYKLDATGDYHETWPDTSPAYVECTVGCQVLMLTVSTDITIKGGNSMHQIVPVTHFTSFYIFGMPELGDREQAWLLMVLPKNAITDLCHDEVCGDGWVRAYSDPVPGTQWEIWHKHLEEREQLQHKIYHIDEDTLFGLYLYRLDAGQGALTALGLDLATESCFTTLVKVDDKVDNDCDGNIDEETANGEDDDKDGAIDEDIGTEQPALLNGKWGKWSSWDCGIRCGGKAQFRRFRLCDNPAPIGGGRPCPGDNSEDGQMVCDYSHIPCPEDCPLKKWGYMCARDCPKTCVDNLCDPVTGYCNMCPLGRTGMQCSFKCPRLMFGANCSQYCGSYCLISDCHPETGECAIGLSTVPFVLMCLALSAIPPTLIIAVVYWCRSQDPERIRLQRTIKIIDYQITRVKLILQARGGNQRELRRRSVRSQATSSGTKESSVDSRPTTAEPGAEALAHRAPSSHYTITYSSRSASDDS